MKGFRTALAFLTRLPGGRHPSGQEELARSVPWFPMVGIVIGALGSAVYVGAAELVSPTSAAVLAFIVTALATGGFHEDGLADTFDALAGGWDREQRLAILKDSRHGTFGVLSLVLITMLKVSALATLTCWDAAAALIAAHSLGRAAPVVLMAFLPAARDGLGASYAYKLSPMATIAGAATGIVVAVAAFGVWAPAIIAASAVGVAAMGWWSMVKIGGVTGDQLGAGEQVAEAIILLGAASIALQG